MSLVVNEETRKKKKGEMNQSNRRVKVMKEGQREGQRE